MRFAITFAVCFASVWAVNGMAAEFIVGPELKKLDELTRKRIEQATRTPAKPDAVRVPDADEVDLLQPGGRPLAGIAVQPASLQPEAARIQRNRAANYLQDSVSPPPAFEEDPSWPGLLPGGQHDERANDLRSRARGYSQGVGPDAAHDSRARQHTKMATSSASGDNVDLSNVGRDGIPIVPCVAVGNVSGRIGDDSLSGQLVQVVRQGRQISVRCK